VATRIVELDRGVLRSYPGNFAAYERQASTKSWSPRRWPSPRADKLLAQEEVWIRKGVEARRTRSVGRVARLEAAATAPRAATARPGAAGGRRRERPAARSWPS
jgi:ATP-binding cassette subfamily F protein uup